MSTQSTLDKHTLHDELVPSIAPPHVPFGFVLRAAPMPLITGRDGRYIARAYDEMSENEGLLVYEECRSVMFLTGDEIVAFFMYLLQEGANLLTECDPSLSTIHTQGIEYMRSPWWKEQMDKVNAAQCGRQEAVQ